MVDRSPQIEDKYILRFEDKGMREQVRELAKVSGRKTINAELNFAIKAHISAKSLVKPPSEVTLSDADVDRIAVRVVQLLKSQ